MDTSCIAYRAEQTAMAEDIPVSELFAKFARFDWDPRNATSNLRNHEIDFEDVD